MGTHLTIYTPCI